jgi:hypothetical protein
MFQGDSNKVTRLYLSCFNVSPVIVNQLEFKKVRSGGVYGLKYVYASFDKDAESGEFFIEFTEQIGDHYVSEVFQQLGACQVMTTTFPRMDFDESAAAALVRVMTTGSQTGIVEIRGECSPALFAKAQAKLADEENKMSSKEFDEKTQAVINQQLQEVKGGSCRDCGQGGRAQ